jgi:hypothetical protein
MLAKLKLVAAQDVAQVRHVRPCRVSARYLLDPSGSRVLLLQQERRLASLSQRQLTQDPEGVARCLCAACALDGARGNAPPPCPKLSLEALPGPMQTPSGLQRPRTSLQHLRILEITVLLLGRVDTEAALQRRGRAVHTALV